MLAGRLSRKHFRGDKDCIWVNGVRATAKLVKLLLVQRVRPPANLYKLNSDASLREGCAVGAVVVRDCEGKLVFAGYKEFGDVEVLVAKVLALLVTLRMCAKRGFARFLIKVDSRLLTHLVSSRSAGKWPLCNALHQIHYWLKELWASLRHVYREANSTTDTIVTLDLGQDYVFDHVNQLPSLVRVALVFDAQAVPFVRVQIVRE